MLEPDLLAFIRTSIPSIWALELLLLLRRSAPAALTRDELVQRLRATPTLIDRLVDQLAAGGVVARDPAGAIRFECSTLELRNVCDLLDAAAMDRPIALRDAISASPNDKLRNFADAFRFKGPDKDKGEGK